MANRDRVIGLIKESSDKTLNDELEYYMEVDREYKYDLADALDDVYTLAEENRENSLIKVIRLILIECGYFVKQPEKTDVGRDTRFTLNKEKYQCVGYWEGWINE